MTFNDFTLKNELIQAVAELGFEIPTPIQEQVIEYMLENSGDLTGLAQTGTGKTAAYGLPVLNGIEIGHRSPQAVILSPTRELCLQISGDLTSYGKYLRGLSVTSVYGGDSMARQIRALKDGTHVIVATPGRLLDLLNRKLVATEAIRLVVLDEADIMLNMGFKDEMDAILAALPSDRRTLLLSATMQPEVARIAAEYMRDPVEIRVGTRNSGATTVEHGYYIVHARDKYLALKRIVDFHPGMYAIIFARTRASTQEIADHMIRDGYNAEPLHGDMGQVQREAVMKKFRERRAELLVATDIAARGLDVDDLSHVIHYDLPDEPEVYTHRSGRTGRAGKSGISLAIINMREKYKLREIERTIKGTIAPIEVPSGEKICERQLMHLIDRVQAVDVDNERIARYMPVIEEKLSSLNREELLSHFVSLEFNRFLDYYRAAPELRPVVDVTGAKGGRAPGTGGRRSRYPEGSGSFSTVRFNVGRKEQITPPDIIGIINRATKGTSVEIGRIDIRQTETLCQIDAASVGLVVAAVAGGNYRGRQLRVEPAGFEPNRRRRDNGAPARPYDRSPREPRSRRPATETSTRDKGSRKRKRER